MSTTDDPSDELTCEHCRRPTRAHWRGRPCLALPPDAEVLRASGDAACDACGEKLRDHPRRAYPWGEGHAVLGCDGRHYHL